MRELFIRYVPVKGPSGAGKVEEETLPLSVGETVLCAWPVNPKLVAVLIVYTELSDLRHNRKIRMGGE